MRDDKGRFIRGHSPLTGRDKTTGRFVSKKTVEFIEVEETVETLEEKIDRIIQEKELNK